MAKIEKLIKQMAHVRSVPYLQQDHIFSSLGSFVTRILDEYRKDLYQVAVKEKTINEVPKRVVGLTGLPCSGKTYFENIIRKYIHGDIDKYKWLKGIKQLSVNWEEDGEDRARDKGAIQTSPNEPFRRRELVAASSELADATAEAISKSHWVTLEVPAISSVRIDGRWLGRPLGTQVVYDLARGEGPFAGLFYIPYFIGFMAGPLLRQVLLYSREDFRNASSLKEAVHLAYIYGKEVPTSQLQWDRLKQGATTNQVQYIEYGVQRLIDSLEERSLIKRPPRKLFGFAYPAAMRDLLTEQQYDEDYNNWAIGVLIDFFFRNRDNLNLINPEQRFIGYNSPTAEDLHITDVGRLADHLRNKKVNYISLVQNLF